jgi:nitric oxide reductase NorE protein
VSGNRQMTDIAEARCVAGSADRERPPRHVPGEPGIWVLLFGDLAVFTILFSVYLVERGKQPALFAASQVKLNQTFGAINTLVLLGSSLFVVFATRAIKTERLRSQAPLLTLGGTALGVCFVCIKATEYYQKISAGVTPNTNQFFMYYFVLTGLHLFHVTIGLIVLLLLSRLATKPPTGGRIAFFEVGACFWHLVDLLWIVIFPLIFLVR